MVVERPRLELGRLGVKADTGYPSRPTWNPWSYRFRGFPYVHIIGPANSTVKR